MRMMWMCGGALVVGAHLGWMVAENVVESAQPGAQALFGRLEHMFASVRWGSDGTGSQSATFVASGGGAQRGPDLELVPNALDDVVGELGRSGVAAEVRCPDAGADRLKRRFVDRA